MAGEARFPRYDLDSSIEVARAIHERGAGGVASGDELSAFLSYSSTVNGAYLYRLSAARQFDLITGNHPAIRITPLALDIIRPDHPDAPGRARLEAFLRVPLYERFLEINEGRDLPPPGHLRNALAKLGIPEKETAVALARLLDSANQAGLFRIAGGPTRMIRPTFADRADEPDERPTAQVIAVPSIDGSATTPGRFPKIIDGALDSLPNERQWDEDEFVEWLDFFERALRVHYRLPRRKRGEVVMK